MSVNNAPVSLEDYPLEALRCPAHEGENFVHVLARIHGYLQPRTYLEIGTQAGQSLALSRCPSIAVDPGFQVASNVFSEKPASMLFQCGSDAFFADHDPAALFGGPIEFAFLDGMHWFEFLLRDFMNVEQHAKPNSIIAIHDCIPIDIYSARREVHDQTNREISEHPEWWAGDVWKVIHILRRARPDLRIYAFDADPTGLILITRLNPKSRLLQERYFELVEEMRDVNLADIGLSTYMDLLPMRSTASIATHSALSELFWL